MITRTWIGLVIAIALLAACAAPPPRPPADPCAAHREPFERAKAQWSAEVHAWPAEALGESLRDLLLRLRPAKTLARLVERCAGTSAVGYLVTLAYQPGWQRIDAAGSDARSLLEDLRILSDRLDRLAACRARQLPAPPSGPPGASDRGGRGAGPVHPQEWIEADRELLRSVAELARMRAEAYLVANALLRGWPACHLVEDWRSYRPMVPSVLPGAEARMVTSAEVELLFGPGWEYPAAARLPAGSEVRVRHIDGEWAEVTSDSGRGFVPLSELEPAGGRTLRSRREGDPALAAAYAQREFAARVEAYVEALRRRVNAREADPAVDRQGGQGRTSGEAM